MIIYDAFEFRVQRARCEYLDVNEEPLFPSRSFEPLLINFRARESRAFNFYSLFHPSLTNTGDRAENNERVIMRTWKVFTIRAIGNWNASYSYFWQVEKSMKIFPFFWFNSIVFFLKIRSWNHFWNLSTKNIIFPL